MKQTYFIGEQEFQTKGECQTYTRQIITNLGCGIIHKDHPHFLFFVHLLQNHPKCNEKMGVGIDYFCIQLNNMKKNNYETKIKRLDGSEMVFSWNQCCEFKKRTASNDLFNAMRTAIKDDIIHYKQSQRKLICCFCKTENELYENYHVDHHNPSFQTIKDNFLQNKQMIPLLFGKYEITNLTMFKEEDADFKKEWIDYHKKNCNLQILCRNCNLRKKKT